jgi:hypothetical protein
VINEARTYKKREPLYRNNKTFTFAVGKGNYPKHIIRALTARGNWKLIDEENAIETANLFWKQLNFTFLAYDKFDTRSSHDGVPLIFNHMEVNRGICTKTGLVRSLKSYYANLPAAVQANYSVFDSTPTSFVVARATDDSEISPMMHRFNQLAKGGTNKERMPWKHCESNMWLVKPANAN